MAIWSTYVINNNEKIIVVCDSGKEQEVITRLTRTGLDNIVGFLQDGFGSWKASGMPIDKVDILQYQNGDDFAKKTSDGVVLDIRDPGELENGVYEKAIFKNFAQLRQSLEKHPDLDKKIYIHCQAGIRSLVGYSLMKRLGYKVTDVEGGFKNMASKGAKTVKWAGKQSCTLI